jgi:hypothetical protein
MSKRLSLKVDPAAISMAGAIRVAARAAPLPVLTGRALADLAAELGSMEAAMAEVLAIATETGRPIGVNFTLGPGRSRTVFIPPKGWSEQKLAGWVAGRHQELEGEFGQVSRIGPGRPT